MDGTRPVDIDDLADTTPRPCRFIYAETATFGPDVEEFHKTTFQDPPKGGLISEGAAAYRDVGTARRAFGALVSTVGDCAASSAGELYVGDWQGRRRLAALPAGRLRPRLPGAVVGVAGGHLLRLSALGVRHRDDEHRRQHTWLAAAVPAMVALPSTSSPSGSGR